MLTRTLRLRAETLTELTVAELAGVAGANERLTLSCPLYVCVESEANCTDPSAMVGCRPLPTVPPNCNTVPC